ncbi:MAG TPA: hypothetical protein V6C91_22210 [Coleofasciculaceae cyanobacterium]
MTQLWINCAIATSSEPKLTLFKPELINDANGVGSAMTTVHQPHLNWQYQPVEALLIFLFFKEGLRWQTTSSVQNAAKKQLSSATKISTDACAVTISRISPNQLHPNQMTASSGV